MWIIFEGLDKVGKTTLERKFIEATNYNHVVIDRGPVGYLLFDDIFNRFSEDGAKEYFKQIDQINNSDNYFVIYLYADIDVVEKRLNEYNEKFDYDYRMAQIDYNILIDDYYKNVPVIKINTSNISIDDTIKIITDKFNEYRRGN